MAAIPMIPLMSSITAAYTVSRARVGEWLSNIMTTRITTSTDTAARVRIIVP